MANDDKIEEQEYIDAVNSGYFLNKYSPEIAELIVSARGDSQWLQGFKKGKELLDEEERAMIPDWLKDDRVASTKNDIEPKKDKSDIEPDR